MSIVVTTLAFTLNPSDPQWQFWIGLLSLVLSIIGVIVSIVLFLQAKPKKIISYKILSDASIINVNKDLGEDIAVTLLDDNQQVNDARIIVICLTHIGNAAIEKKDFNYIRFVFTEDVVLRCGIQQTSRPKFKDDYEMQHALIIDPKKQSYVELEPISLNPKDEIIIKILIRQKSQPEIKGDIINGSIIPARPERPGFFRKATVITTLTLLAILLTSAMAYPISKFINGSCALGNIIVGGSSSFSPSAEKAAKEYMLACPLASITVIPSNSGAGIDDLRQERIQLAISELPLNLAEKRATIQLKAEVVDIIPFVLVINSEVTGINNLTSKQLQDIYAGKIKNWQTINPSLNLTIHAIGRSTNDSGTRIAFERQVLGGASGEGAISFERSEQIANEVAVKPGAIGYVDLSTAEKLESTVGVEIIAIDDIKANSTTIEQNYYKFWALEYVYIRENASPLTKSFLNYLKNKQQQADSYINYKELTKEALNTHR